MKTDFQQPARDRAPYLSVENPQLASQQGDSVGIRPGAICALKNSGNTPALLQRLNIQCVNIARLHRGIPYAVEDIPVPQYPIAIAIHEREQFPPVYGDWCSFPEWTALNQTGRYTTGTAVFMYGFARYTDVFRNRSYTLGFAWIFDPEKQRRGMGFWRQATATEAPGCNYEEEEDELISRNPQP